jgi:NAD(P)-dependent dehydrogenase (short-subunit alcohol dehydrogenase family)
MSPPLPQRFESKVAIVAGATGGLGEAIARRLAQEGAAVVLLARNQERLDALAQSLTEAKHRVVALSCDLSQTASLRELVAELQRRLGVAQILVNCVGSEQLSPFVRTSDEDIGRVLNANLRGTFELTREFGRMLLDAKQGGAVVNLASVIGQVGVAGSSVYGAAKAAIIGWTRCLAIEWAAAGIRVNAIAPGVVETPLFSRVSRRLSADQLAHIKAAYPLGLGRPEDVAAAAAFLASSDARWITGTVLTVDGGYSAR